MAKSGKKAKKTKTNTAKANLKFSPGVIGGQLKRGRFAKRADHAAPRRGGRVCLRVCQGPLLRKAGGGPGQHHHQGDESAAHRLRTWSAG